MNKQTAFSFILTCLISTAFIAPPSHAQDRDYYEEGKVFLNTPAWEKALQTWWRGYNALDMEGLSDPRIGVGFIELAVSKKAFKYFGTASTLYVWGFSKIDPEESAREFKLELLRLYPLLQTKARKEWQKLEKEENYPELYEKIKTFWLLRDPTPTTQGNERLIEHWERIIYARKEYRNNVRLPYLADPRAEIYVKYGKPHRTKSGTMGLNRSELVRLVRDPAIRADIARFDEHPDYELWVYENLAPGGSGVFLFGPRDGHGAWALLNGVEDLIPQRVFGGSANRHTGIPAGYYLQLMYYNELRVMDTFFDRRYGELNNEWSQSRGPNVNKLKDTRLQFSTVDEFDPATKYAVPEKSDYEQNFSRITVRTRQGRFLDENNQPKLAVFAFSYPKFKPGEVEIIDKKAIKVPEFSIEHTIIARDERLDEVDREKAGVIEGVENVAIFIIKDIDKTVHYTISAEAVSAKSSPRVDGLPQSHVFAAGKAELRKREPLSMNPDSLELSDIIVGTAYPAGVDYSQFPFPVLPGERFMNIEPLQIYFEAYHLSVDKQGESQYEVNIKVSRTDEAGRPSIDEEAITSTFDLSSAGETAKEPLGISILNLARGYYMLTLTLTDKISGQTNERSQRFSVIQPR